MRKAVILASAYALLGIFACASGSTTNQTSGDAGHAGSTAQGGSGGSVATGSGGKEPLGDSVPLGAVSFFQGSACPAGWGAHEALTGRVVVPTVDDALGGEANGEPLASGEDRLHAHTMEASFTLPAFSYVGIAGEANHGVAAAGTVKASGQVDEASTGLPYVQLLACKKLVDPVAGASPLPIGMLMFFETTGCPEGWKQAPSTQGRMLVGLPEGAMADEQFGGAPIEGTAPRTHTHGTDPILVTEPHGIALASGCCASGYAVDGTYQSVQPTSATDPALPYVTLLQCQKQ